MENDRRTRLTPDERRAQLVALGVAFLADNPLDQLTIEDLSAAIQRATTYQGAGQFDGPNRTFLLQPQGQLDNARAYENMIVATRNGAPVYVKDVAQASDSVEDERVDMRFWVRGREVPKATVVVAVFRQAGANAVEVAKEIYDVRPEIQAQLPGSVTIIPIHDRSKTIVNSVRDVKETLYIAFALVVIVIFMFLGRVTDTLIPVVALPLSGSTSTSGSRSGGKPSGVRMGASRLLSASMPPAPRNMPMATRIATREGMMRSETWKPSFAPSTNSSYTFTPRSEA